MSRMTFTADSENEGVRIDKWLCCQNLEASRSMLQKLLDNGKITVNGLQAVKSYTVKCGDEIIIDFPEPVELNVVSENIPIEIVYQDEHLLVVNKPKGMVVHPAAGNYSGTLVNALLYHCKGQLSSINGIVRPGIVHRIDKNTSGLLIVAKTDKAHVGLAEQIKAHKIGRAHV